MSVDLGALQRQYSSWGIVDAIEAPNGGIWALGADGGVFSLNAQGGTSGTVAPFFGSYPALAPEARQGTRSFVAIQRDPTTNGYVLVSNQPGQTYRFEGNEKIGGAAQPVAAPTTGIDFSEADLNGLQNLLKQHGLGDLIGQAWDYFKSPQGAAGDPTKVLDWLPTTQQYRDHFPGLVEMGEQGRAWTPAQWNTYYNQLQQSAVEYGIPPGMVDRADVGKMLVGNVSLNEAVGRIQAAGQSVLNADPVLIQKMRDFGFSDGDLTAFYLDPDKAAPLLERKAQEGQARIAAAAQRTGYDPALGLGTAQGLQKLGVDEAEAEQGFAKLGDFHPLFANTAGESMAGEAITTEEQLGATFGQNTAAQREIEDRLKRRQAGFQGGGGAATGGSGSTGLG